MKQVTDEQTRVPRTMRAVRMGEISAGGQCHSRCPVPELQRELNAECAVSDALLAALKEFMDMWNSGDSTNPSKRAQQRRAEMWDKAKAAIALAETRHE